MRHGALSAVLLGGCFYVSEAERAARWDLDDDGVERPADCDDDDPEVWELATWHADADDDGFGDPTVATRACRAPEGFVADDADCDDTLATVYPGAAEVCDNRDNDCDQQIDENLTELEWYVDADEDGFGDEDAEEPVRDCRQPDGYAPTADDCADDDATINPGEDEVCGNGVDEDCRGGPDDGC